MGRHKDFKAGFRRLKKVNAEIVGLLRRYQQQMSRQGGRRLGLGKSRSAEQKMSV